ncbi:Na+/H+ antiporter [Zalaria obscura]|uniref:Na+/H+ antiporter n=1 Tax=Zalaria obscura TaxID=2024903 RepID=A0ACC3SNG8_9PEZI
MAWEQLAIDRPHLVYIILGGFTSLFMLCSSVIKEKLYIGEATVATICGIIFGPHAANLIDPGTWGNTDQITLEFSRIVLVVQCFAVGVELPKAYMERHWRSVVFLLIPVMTFGWLVTSLFVWGLIPNVNWLDSLCIAACVTATDPVLASSVVGKGKFAKRVPKHLRDLLSAESGCNDGMAFPFIYLALYLLRYRPDANTVAFHWFCYTILYECIFGAFYGVCVGYAARRAIRAAHERDLIDRESFLVFYFVLALFCAGSGSILGMDDLLIGFACGVGFSNDGWFTEKTEESHVSNVIDLLINLAFFVYFGTIIPWEQYNADVLGLKAWRLVVVGILVLFFRRIPVMLALKPLIPDVKTWREALFAGHFGPIGVGALFVAILARAELETEGTTPLATLPEEGFEHLNVIELIWPVTTFLVICSIIVHGSSIAVFTLGKHINTLTLTMSYTTANEEGPSWMDRLPRIQSRSKSSMSMRRPDDTESEVDEKADYPSFPDGVMPGNFLRRQKEDDNPRRPTSRRSMRRRQWDSGRGPGGPISQSAISPAPRVRDYAETQEARSDSDTLAPRSDDSPDNPAEKESNMKKAKREAPDQEGEPQGEVYEEGDETVYEDEEGNVLEVERSREETPEARRKHEQEEARRLFKQEHVHHGVAEKEEDPDKDPGHAALQNTEKAGEEAVDAVEHPGKHWKRGMKRMGTFGRKQEGESDKPAKPKPKSEPKRGPARAYQFGNTIIVEDEDGEVLKKYNIPGTAKKQKAKAESGAADNKAGRLVRRAIVHGYMAGWYGLTVFERGVGVIVISD